MNNDRGVGGKRRESHSVTLQWCSRDQSKTTILNAKASNLVRGKCWRAGMGLPVTPAASEAQYNA